MKNFLLFCILLVAPSLKASQNVILKESVEEFANALDLLQGSWSSKKELAKYIKDDFLCLEKIKQKIENLERNGQDPGKSHRQNLNLYSKFKKVYLKNLYHQLDKRSLSLERRQEILSVILRLEDHKTNYKKLSDKENNHFIYGFFNITMCSYTSYFLTNTKVWKNFLNPHFIQQNIALSISSLYLCCGLKYIYSLWVLSKHYRHLKRPSKELQRLEQKIEDAESKGSLQKELLLRKLLSVKQKDPLDESFYL